MIDSKTAKSGELHVVNEAFHSPSKHSLDLINPNEVLLYLHTQRKTSFSQCLTHVFLGKSQLVFLVDMGILPTFVSRVD